MRYGELRVGHHARQTFLYELEASDRLAELNPLSCVLDSCFVGSRLDTGCHPSHHEAGGLENFVGASSEVLRVSQLITIGNEAILESDVSVLSDPERHFALHLPWHETRRALLNDESLNSATIILITSPNNYITHGSVADPAFLAIQNIAAFNFASRCL